MDSDNSTSSQETKTQEMTEVATVDDIQEGSNDAKEGSVDTKVEDKNETVRFENGLVDQSAFLPHRQIIIVLLALNLAVALSFLDQTIVSTALPSIAADFNSGSESWVASAYLLTTTATLPVWGRLSEIFGRKATLLCCIAIFLVFSLGSALATNITSLIIFRAFQGVGGGGLLTLVLIIISDIVSLKDRGKYAGIMEGVITISNGIGPVIGGVLSDRASWRFCFWLNLPLGALTLAVVIFFLPLKAIKGEYRKKLSQIDYGGSILTILATTLLLLPLNWAGTTYAWNSPTVLGCLLGSLGLFVLLGLWEWKVAVIPVINVFSSSTVNAVFGVTFIAGMVILTQLFYIPQYLQIVLGVSAIRSGVLILPLLLTITAFVIFSGQLIARTGDYKPSIVVGYFFWTVGLALLSTLDQNTSTARLIGYLLITAIGQGQTLQTTLVAIQASVPRSDMSVVTSTRNFLRSLGGTIAIAIAATIINNILRTNLLAENFSDDLITSIINDSTGIWQPSKTSGSVLFDLPQSQKDLIITAYVKGFQTVFHVYIGLMGLNFFVALLFIKRHNLNRDDEAELKAKGKAWIEHRGNKKGKKVVDVEKGEEAVKSRSISGGDAMELEKVIKVQ